MFTSTKVPRFAEVTSWEQYHQYRRRYSCHTTVVSPGGRCTERAIRTGLVGALFEKTGRKEVGDPSIFAMALETLAVKAFGDMGQVARLRLIRDRFVTGHDSCDLRRHLDSVAPETPIWDIVDIFCRAWESHADTEAWRPSKPRPERALPIYTVEEPAGAFDDRMVETLLRRLLPTPIAPAPPSKPVPTELESLLQQWASSCWGDCRYRRPLLQQKPGSLR